MVLSWILQKYNTICDDTGNSLALDWLTIWSSKSDCERGKDSKGAQGTDSSASENLTDVHKMRKWQMPRSRACNGAIDIILNIEGNTGD